MARNDYWRIDADAPGVTNLPIGGHDGAISNQTFGGGYDFGIWLTPESDSPAGEWPGHEERYRRLVGFQDFAGQFTLHDIENGRVAFTERHDGPSLLITVKPPTGSEFGRGGFYLIESATDATTLPSTLAQLQFSLTFVAKYDSGGQGEAGYRTRREVRNALEAPTLI